MQVIKRNGKLENVSFDKIIRRIDNLSSDLNRDYIDPTEVAKKVIEGLYDGVSTSELDKLAAETSASLATKHPDFLKLAAYISVSNLHKNTTNSFYNTIKKLYNYVDPNTNDAAPLVSEGLFNTVKQNKKEIESQLDYNRDYLFDYFGFKTLERSYLIKCKGVVVERPQHLFMRVSLGIHGDDLEKAFETYHLMSQKYFIHATPTLFNAGTPRPQLSSCFLMTVGDSVEDMYDSIKNCAKISKYAGGIGFSVHDVRAQGSYIKGTSGYSNGLVPMLKVFNETARHIDQGGGRRKGSFASYVEPWHSDIFEFLDLKKNHGKEEMRARDLFYAMWIPDLFMQRVQDNGEWSLFCPNECKGLSDTYGEDFELLYTKYEKEDKARKTVKAQELWFAILESQIETGTPYMLYKDACNEKSNQKNLGTIKSSNLCCIAGDQRVPTQKGMLTIKELYEEGTENLVVGREKIETASEMLLPRPNAEMGIIKTKQGYTHKVTPDHKVWVVDKGWVEAQYLKRGDKLSIQSIEGLFGEVDEPQLAFITGLISGDGTFSNSGAIIDLWDKTLSLKEDVEIKVENVIESYSDYLDEIHNPAFDKPHLFVSNVKPKFVYCKTKDNSTKYRLSSKHLMDILKSKGFTKETKTKVPDFIWKGNKKTIVEYLKGLFYTDGTVQASKGLTTISYSSINKSFIEDLQILLSNFGIKSSINLSRESCENLLPDGKGGVKKYKCKAVYRLLITSKKCCLILNSLIGIGEFRNNKTFIDNLKSEGYSIKMECDFESYERLPNEDAYCLMVDSEEHSWVVNGIVTKNTEIIEYTSKEEVAVCNLASLSLPKYINDGVFDFERLHEVTRVVTNNLNKVIDINYYPIEEARNSNLRHRPIGIGVQGLADAYILMGYPFDSEEARQLNKDIFETIYHAAVTESVALAEKNGAYSTFEGSPASQGKLQFDLWGVKPSQRYDWEGLKSEILLHGMRNSLLLAPMPTASTSQILGNNECIEPYTSNLYSRRTLSGEFVIVNKHLLLDLVDLGLWDEDMREELIANNGSIQSIDSIPQEVKDLYKTVWEISQKVIIDQSADRGAYVCQSQSLNLFLESPNFSKLSSMHFYAWKKGLKTGMYYLRSKAAADPIKFTLSSKYQNKYGDKNEEDNKTCDLDEGCIMCSG